MLKRSVKLLVSLFFFPASWLVDAIRRLIGHPSYPHVIVLYYHAVPSEQRLNFARQLDMLLRWATPIAADLKSTPANGTRCAAVTFDDGLQSFAHHALPPRNLDRCRVTPAVPVGRWWRT